MKTLQKIIEKIVNVLMVIVVIAILFCIYSVVSLKMLKKEYINFFGYSIFEVATGSMANEINVNDAVIVKINDDYNVGDIVTYRSGNDFITHRVMSMENNYIVTKGDANNVADNPIDKSLVLGRVIKIIPELGVWKKVLLTPKVIILILITLFIFSILFSYNGKAIKIVSSKHSEDEINKKIEEEVNKKMISMKRRRRAPKKVLEATQIIDLNEVNNKLQNSVSNDTVKNDVVSAKKSLDATQIIDLKKVNDKVVKEQKSSKKTLDATQIIDINEVNKKINNQVKKNKKTLDATQIIDIKELNKRLNSKEKTKKTLDATQIIDINEINKKVNNQQKGKKKTLDATQIIDISSIVGKEK